MNNKLLIERLIKHSLNEQDNDFKTDITIALKELKAIKAPKDSFWVKVPAAVLLCISPNYKFSIKPILYKTCYNIMDISISDYEDREEAKEDLISKSEDWAEGEPGVAITDFIEDLRGKVSYNFIKALEEANRYICHNLKSELFNKIYKTHFGK